MENEAIYTEAILFFAVFTTMYIISFFVSRKNAKKFEEENPLEIRKTKLQKQKELERAKIKRLPELTKLYSTGIINHREYKLLQRNLDYIVA